MTISNWNSNKPDLPIRAFLLGAGLGRRLRPLTSILPKPLVPLHNKPLVEFSLDHLIASGFDQFIINTHHLPHRWREHFGGDGTHATYRDAGIVFRHEPVLLETGGGIANIRELAGNSPLLVHNGDILASFPLRPAIDAHLDSGRIATLVLRSFGGPLQVGFDPGSGLVRDFRETLHSGKFPLFLFTGIYLVSPEIFARLQYGGSFSIIETFLALLSDGFEIGGIVLDEGLWLDLGDRSAYLAAHKILRDCNLDPGFPLRQPLEPISPQATIHPDATLLGACAVGPGCTVAPDALLADSVLWPGAKIASRSRIERCIVASRLTTSGCFSDIDLA